MPGQTRSARSTRSDPAWCSISRSRAPVISNRIGGISGAAIHPIAVRCVNDIARAVNVPIIGIGGNQTARDAIEMIIAGAHAVGIGSGIYTRGLGVFVETTRGIEEYMQRHKFARLDEFRASIRETAPVVGVRPAALIPTES